MKSFTKYNIILASNSSRRKDILNDAHIPFESFVPKNDETDIIGKAYDPSLVILCAKNKAQAAYNELSKVRQLDTVVIVSCDTVVINDNIIIGKPKDKEDAFYILKSLSDKTHSVVSAICIIKKDSIFTDYETTYVTFRKLEDDEIYSYIEDCKPYDKAGSYGIQDPNFNFVKNIKGSLDNVIGFPLMTFYKMLDKL